MWGHIRETDVFTIFTLYPRLQIRANFKICYHRQRLYFFLLHDVKQCITVKLTKKTNKEGDSAVSNT